MKILVIGGSGVIGLKLVEHFGKNEHKVDFTFKKNQIFNKFGLKLDITQKEKTIEIITKINPDVVIHSAALTNVDLCETNNQLADSINVGGTENVIEGCKITKSKIVYISTSFVFDGKKNEYFETDSTSPATYYGLTKWKSEKLVKKSSLPYLILRTDQPYCWVEKWQHTNSVLRVFETLRSGKVLKEIIDWYNRPTYVPNFVEATDYLITNSFTGIFHLVGSDYLNRYDWALKTAEIFILDKEMIEPIPSKNLNLSAKRVNVNLSNKKLFKKTDIRMMNVKGGLMEMFKIKEHNFK